MADVDKLILQVLPAADSDAEELADLAGELHAELLGADAVSVAPLSAEGAPEGAKGLGTLAGWLIAQVGTLDGLRLQPRRSLAGHLQRGPNVPGLAASFRPAMRTRFP